MKASFRGKAKIRPAKDTLLLPYQAKWVKDSSRLKIAEKARQLGWTWATAYRLVSTKSLKDAVRDAWISSRDDIQSRLFLEDCKSFAQILQAGAQDLGERVIDEKGHSAYVLQFANGLRGHSMSSNPDAQAGKRGDRILDEFALHPDPKKLYSIAYPGITWGGSMEIFSTHRGSQNYFNELIREIREKGNPKKFSLHRVTLSDALAQGFLYKLQTKLPEEDERQEMDEAEYYNFIKSGCADEESFLEEFECVPSDDASAFLSYELIGGCHYPVNALDQYQIHRLAYRSLTDNDPAEHKIGTWSLKDATGPLFVGVDIGRTRDLTVIWVEELLGDVGYTRLVIELSKTPFSRQEAILYPILEHPLCRRACIDRSGIGMQFAERGAARFPSKVEGYAFTAGFKDEIATPVRPAFEDRKCRQPDDKLIIADFRSIRKMATSSDVVRFAGERGKNGHADRFWARALSQHARKTNHTGYGAIVI